MKKTEARERLEHIRRHAEEVKPTVDGYPDRAYARLLGAIQGFSIAIDADPPCACGGREPLAVGKGWASQDALKEFPYCPIELFARITPPQGHERVEVLVFALPTEETAHE